MSKTLAIIIGTMLAVAVLTIAAFGIIMYISAEEEDFSRASVFITSQSLRS